MKTITLVRLYGLLAAALLVGWLINLYEALTRPPVDWRNVADAPLLVAILFALGLLQRARNRRSANRTGALSAGKSLYVAVSLMVAGLVAAFFFGFHARQ